MNMNMNENKVTERNVQAEHSNASASNAIVDDSAAASNELDALRAALQRTQQALAKAEHEVEQLRTQAADIHADTDTKTAIVTTTDSNKDADTISISNTILNTNGLDSHDSNINGYESVSYFDTYDLGS